MRIAVGGILHNRWTVGPYLSAMLALDPAGHEVQWTWVVDSTRRDFPFADHLPPDAVAVYAEQWGGPAYERKPIMDARENRVIYGRLAGLRNMLADLVLATECDALLSVDSDIVVPRNLLRRLAEAERPWAAALVRNSREDDTAWNVFGFSAKNPSAIGRFMPELYPEDGPPRDRATGRVGPQLAAGAVCLYRCDLLRAARWETDARGCQEDIGFARNAFAAGFSAAYLPIQCKHLTVDGEP